MKKILVYILLATIALTASGQSATREIRGVVTDAATGEPLIGATIYVKGNDTTGATTGLDGSFVLKTNAASPVICCSCIGFRTLETDY